MEGKSYCVYCYTNKQDGKKYVGMTSLTLVQRRKNGYGYANQYFGEVIRKHGWASFTAEILEKGLTREEAKDKEREYISKYNTMDKEHGYNICYGSGGGFINHHHTDESKGKISDRMKNYHITDEHRRHLSESKSGVNHHLAKKVYQYSKCGEFIREWDYMSEATKVLGIKKSDISANCKGKRPSAGGYVWRYERM